MPENIQRHKFKNSICAPCVPVKALILLPFTTLIFTLYSIINRVTYWENK